MKKLIVLIVLISMLTTVLVGCSTQTSNRIPDGMTGQKDYWDEVSKGDSVVFVYGTKGSERATKIAKATTEFLMGFLSSKYPKSSFVMKSDEEITEEDIKNSHFFIFGNSSTNSFLKRMNSELPIRIEEGKLYGGDKVLSEDESALCKYIAPNPLNKSKYVNIFSSIKGDYIPYTVDVTGRWTSDIDFVVRLSGNEKYNGVFAKSDTEWTFVKPEKNQYALDDYITVEGDHFTYTYSPVDTSVPDNIDAIMKESEAFYDKAASKLNIDYSEKIKYYFFINRDWQTIKRERAPDFRAGEIYSVYSEDGISEFLISLSMISKKYGLPLDDVTTLGLLGYVFSEDNQAHEAVKKLIDSKACVPLIKLKGYYRNRSIDRETYKDEADSFARYLIDTYGFDKYTDYVEENQSKHLEEALYNTYGKALGELEEEWLEYVKSQ